MPKSPKAIIFDLGNVLFDIDIHLCSNNIKALLRDDIDQGDFRSEFRRHNHGLETGEVSKELFLNFIIKHSRPTVHALDVINAWNSMLIGMSEKQLHCLEKIHRKIPLFLLSNTNAFHLPRFKVMLYEDHGITEFDQYFQETTYSHLVGLRKPDHEIFYHVLSHCAYAKEDLLFFDDTLENIVAATKIGIPSIHVKDGNFNIVNSILSGLEIV